MDGIINILKPPGMTSHDVVAFSRRTLKTKKIGHTGTLDPEVSGVLPICVGRATKVVQYLTEQDKVYQGELTLGISTSTQDAFGEILTQQNASHLKLETVQEVIGGFVGDIMQVPPMVSAVKHQGKRLYELAREGIEVEREPRPVSIYSLEITEFGPWHVEHPWIRFRVHCSKGTYVRTLCADIGDKLGVGGHMSKLMRTRSGPFRIAESVTLETLEEAATRGLVEQYLQPIETGVPHLPKVLVKDAVITAIAHGNRIFQPGICNAPEQISAGDVVRLHSSSKILAIAKVITVPDKMGRSSLAFQPITVF